MTLDEAAENVGRMVRYRPHPTARHEYGRITEVRGTWVFVKFFDSYGAKACTASDLELEWLE